MKEIYFAGGCFWGVEEYFKQIKGVVATNVGYANGATATTSYNELKNTDHSEAVFLQYDENIVGLNFLLDMYYKIIDPESVNKQGNDVGRQYRTGIYFVDEEDKPVIEKSIDLLQKNLGIKAVIEVEKLKNYIKAEEYHQNYLQNNPHGYCHILKSEFENARAAKPIADSINDKESYSDLKERLTSLQYEVTQNCATEPPFQNEYWDHFEDGVYVDIVSGEPLFSSADKFECGGGWAAFSKPISPDLVQEYYDNSHGMIRTEVKSSKSQSHLGHIFDDGPAELGGMRYCINSASLKFIPLKDFKK